jgi:hypothetical protein
VEATILRMPRTSVSWGTSGRTTRYLVPNCNGDTKTTQNRRVPKAAGFVERRHDPHDGRVMSLGLTRKDSAALGRLSAQHVEQLARPAEDFRPPWEGPDATDSQLISPVTPGS